MVKKRSVFDIDFDPTAETESPAAPVEPSRRGPMASAITEAAASNQARATAEATIRAENDTLAHEHVRLKKLGLITDLIDVDKVQMSQLTRDRAQSSDPELAELKASIVAVGLSNPIRVLQTEGGYELIQGFRRLSAFRELAEQTGDTRYQKIPAAMVPRGEPTISLYRKMVDENLVRKDISFGEMAQLALSYAQQEDVQPSDAVSQLYASALKQKRSYIRKFAWLLDGLEGQVRFPQVIPRALGLDLAKAIEIDSGKAAEVLRSLKAAPNRNADQELALLRGALTVASKPSAASKSSAKTSLRLPRPEGEARVVASDGRIELRLDKDFSLTSKAKLQAGIEALLVEIED